MSVYDCFTFFNEVDLLEIRLRMLYQYVDKFVIVEMNKTHRGKRKELYFKNNKERYNQYLDKIIYITPQDVPDYKGDGDWTIENFQRTCITRGLVKCEKDDIIMISDLDEIPNPVIVDAIRKNDNKFKVHIPYKNKKIFIKYILDNLGEHTVLRSLLSLKKNKINEYIDVFPIACEQQLFYYFMNCRSHSNWYGTIFCKYKNIKSLQMLRDHRCRMAYVKDAGWHFSYLGGIERIKTKLNAIIDSNSKINNLMKSYADDDAYIKYCLKEGIDIYGRNGLEYEYDFISLNEIGIKDINELYNKNKKLFSLK